jgi:hypothetical protein
VSAITAIEIIRYHGNILTGEGFLITVAWKGLRHTSCIGISAANETLIKT